MKTLGLILLLLPLLSTVGRTAMDVSPLTTPKATSPIVSPDNSPAVQIHILQGRIQSIDRIYQRIVVKNPNGQWGDFLLSATTPINYGGLAPIGFNDLH